MCSILVFSPSWFTWFRFKVFFVFIINQSIFIFRSNKKHRSTIASITSRRSSKGNSAFSSSTCDSISSFSRGNRYSYFIIKLHLLFLAWVKNKETWIKVKIGLLNARKSHKNPKTFFSSRANKHKNFWAKSTKNPKNTKIFRQNEKKHRICSKNSIKILKKTKFLLQPLKQIL